MSNKNEIMYHIHLCKNDIKSAKYALLPGDPARVKTIAMRIDSNAKKLTSNREYTSYLAQINNKYVLICSTGIGGPSTAIAMEELAKIGVKGFIRIGTTGGIQDYMSLGDLIISSGAVRIDGTSDHYAPMSYPAVADYKITGLLTDACNELGVKSHTGITASSATFYPGQERRDSYSGYVPKSMQGTMEEWRQLGVLNYEMESATLFVICSTLGLKAGAIHSVLDVRNVSEHPDKSCYEESINNSVDCVKLALQDLL
jgi:uridine phosphorylase